MHRAEKSSSKICRSREVERAQELHRRKISGVKSYLTGIISKPPAARPPNSFRRNQISVCGTIGGSSSIATLDTVGDKVDSEDVQNGNEEPTTEDPTGSAQSFGSYQDDDDFEGAPEPVKEDPSMWFGGAEHDASICKADEFRSVAPTSIKKGALSPSFPVGPPPAKKSLNRAFRVRKLREIEASNVGLFDRIKRSASHYRNDDLRREWRQNVSYLSSICEFPLARDIIASPTHSQHNSAAASLFRDSEDDDEDLSFLAGKHASITAATTKAASTRGGGGGASLPSIQPSPSAIHPIKAIPTSPKKTALNLAPAFRSLRRSMPQQPGLPPISSPSRGGSIGSGECSLHESSSGLANNSNLDCLVSSPRKTTARLPLHNSRSDVLHNPENVSSPRRAPSILRQASASGNGSATFIGDLQAQEGQPEAPGDLKYQLLKTGRFVGGTYLVLSVFCGDGVRNPYGFDVFAFHRESKCEYTLSVTREMAHELIETSSSRSLAEETEAAAGTNWSMQQIARSICDHVQFAVLESGRGEILFLMPTSDKHTSTIGDASGDNNNRSNGSLLVDVNSHLLSLCVHQVIELESSEFNNFSESDEEQDELDKHSPQSREATYSTRGSKEQQRRHRNKKRRLHVLASTCMTAAATASPGLMFRSHETTSETSRAAISFCVFDQLPPARATAPQSLKSSISSLMTEVIIDELYVVLGGDRDVRHRRISIERMVITAMSHLHIISVPSGGNDSNSEQFKEALILNARVNPQLRFCEGMSISVPITTSTLQRKRSRQQLLTTTTPFFLEPSHPTVLLQTGLVWREAYLLGQVTISIPASQLHTLYQPWRWKDHQMQDIHESIAIRVFNPTSGLFSERVLTPEFVAAILNVSNHESSHSIAASMDTLAFSKLLLSQLHLDADLFGAQVIVFPELERSIAPNSSAAGYRSPSGSPRAVVAGIATTCANAGNPGRKRPVRVVEEEHYPSEAAAAVVLQAHFRGFLIRKNVYQSRFGGPIESVEEAEEGEEDQEEDDDSNESTEVFARYEQVNASKGIAMQISAPIHQPAVEFTDDTSVSAADDASDYETDTAFSDNDDVAEPATDNSNIRTSQKEGNQTKVSAVRKGAKENGRYFLELLRKETQPIVVRIGPLGTLHIGVQLAE